GQTVPRMVPVPWPPCHVTKLLPGAAEAEITVAALVPGTTLRPLNTMQTGTLQPPQIGGPTTVFAELMMMLNTKQFGVVVKARAFAAATAKPPRMGSVFR